MLERNVWGFESFKKEMDFKCKLFLDYAWGIFGFKNFDFWFKKVIE